MKYKNKTKRMNNKGFSLVEVLVALAVSSVVIVMIGALMSNGSFLFKSENNKINLQNELQMVDSFVSETMLEAKALHVVAWYDNMARVSTTLVYTGDRNSSMELLPVAPTNYYENKEYRPEQPSISTERILTFVQTGGKQGLYISQQFATVGNISKGRLISGAVTNFKVGIDSSCESKDKDGNFCYKNPIVLIVTVEVTDGDKTKKEQYLYSLRNKLEEITIYGRRYKVE
jgi:prepilin-type N-terminal cleavage/methylation domain-containing protein